ncbi:MAG: S8 family serine peptidase [Kiritimatiellae bacterium]|nr:S8 family serine peptidase [Kiritimatiellia bacterium]
MRHLKDTVPFRELLDIPLWDLAGRTLRPVRVAVLDSGIDASHEALRGRIVAAEAIDGGGGEKIAVRPLRRSANNDLCGHGTGVASVIAALASNARIADYRVLDAGNTGWGDAVLTGLERALESDAEVINVSIAISKDKWWGKTSKLLEEAYLRGKIVVASKRNFPLPGDLGIPAELPTAISVDSGQFKTPYLIDYFRCSAIEFSAHGEAVFVAKAGGGWTRMTGASFATPMVAALCALLRGANPDLALFEVKALLKHWAETAAQLSKGGERRGGPPPNPLELAPARPARDAGRGLVAWTCPRCGATQDTQDAFPSVRCRQCGAVSHRNVLLDPRVSANIFEEIRRATPPEFAFHNAEHARDTVEAVYRILRHYPRLAAARRRELLFAALMHDQQYAADPGDHEEASAKEAAIVARVYGYTETFAANVAALIKATKPECRPTTLQEKIICDADLFHIGTPAYAARSAALRREFAAQGRPFSDAKWRRHEIEFLSAHRFHLPWLERERRAEREAAVRALSRK